MHALLVCKNQINFMDNNNLFNLEELTGAKEEFPWQKEWVNMPTFNQEELTPYKTLLVHFDSDADIVEFGKLLNQKITPKTKYIWFPEVTDAKFKDKKWMSNES